MWRDMRSRLGTSTEQVASRKRAAAVRDLTKAAFREGVLYKWWYGEGEFQPRTGTFTDYANPLGVFTDHVARNFKWRRENYARMEPNAFTIDLHMKDTFAKTVGKRWEKKWTPEKLANWDSIARIFYRVKSALLPGSVTEEQKRGFLINGNCFLVDGFIEEIVFLVTYCANDFMTNYPLTKRMQHHNNGSAVWLWFESMADRGARDFASDRKYIPDDVLKRKREAEERGDWDSSYEWLMYRGLNWIRPKIADIKWENRREEQMTVWRMLSKQQWERAISIAPFDTTSWVIRLIDSVFGINTELEINNIVGQIEDFINNDNLDYMAAPVGLKYWVLFWVRCQFKPLAGQLPSNAALNLSCAAGIGLEATLGYVLWISILVFVVGSIILPSTLLPLIGGGAFLFYIVLIPAVAWHYSPRCWLMTPSLSIAGINGISVPLLPFPVAFPALPFCLMTEVRHLLNKYITTCYRVLWGTNLEFLFPPYMILTDACPTCPQKVGMANCRTDIGFDGIVSTVSFILVQVWPGATDAVRAVASLSFCQPGSFLNGFCGDTLGLFTAASNATGDQFKQYVWCSFLTSIFAAAIVLLILFLAGTFLAMVIRILIRFFSYLWAVFATSGLISLLPGTSFNLYEDWFGEAAGGITAKRQSSSRRYATNDAFISVQIKEDYSTGAGAQDGPGRRGSSRNRAEYVPVPVGATVSGNSGGGTGIFSAISEQLISYVGHRFKTIKRE